VVHKLLVVEDNPSIGKVIEKIATSLGFRVTLAQSFAQVKTILVNNPKFFAATIDVNLPDAPNGEVIPYVLQSKIPSIVMTGRMDDATRKKILSLPVIDYITKENAQAYHYLLRVLNNQITNKNISVLVVDSSLTSCNETVELLKRRNFTTHAVPDGTKALKFLEDNPNIKIVITAHNMPGMTGIELLQKIRKQHTNNELIVIGTSRSSKDTASAKFIKNGADDFLKKPFCPEEFYCRIMQHIEKFHNLEKIHLADNQDYLTHLLNYRHFITSVKEAQEMSLDDSSTSVLAIIDIDNFKSINETHSNSMGDKVLIGLSQALKKQFNDQILARLGGDQFAALIKAENIEATKAQLQALQQTVNQLEIKDNDNQTNFSICIGATTIKDENSIDTLLKIANDAIIKAKNEGKNKLILTEAS
jgi:diguanylate cyclase (GGDEF)-like protein